MPLRSFIRILLLVLLVHLALLSGSAEFVPAKTSSVQTMATRRIDAPPAPPPAPAAAPEPAVASPPPSVAPRPPPLEKKQPFAGESIAKSAIDNVAKPVELPIPTPPPEPSIAPPSPTAVATAAPLPDAATATASVNPSAQSESASVATPLRGAIYRVPGSIAMNFDLIATKNGQPQRGSAKLVWQQDGAQYEARLLASVFGFTVGSQTSVGQITAAGIKPLRFANNSASEVATHFDYDKGQISFSKNRPAVPLQVGAQDRVSVVLQLASLLAGEPPRFAKNSTIELQTADSDSAEVWVFRMDGDETISLPAGNVIATKLTRNPRREYDRKVEVWLDPRRSYMPVRILQTAPNGNQEDMQLRGTDTP